MQQTRLYRRGATVGVATVALLVTAFNAGAHRLPTASAAPGTVATWGSAGVVRLPGVEVTQLLEDNRGRVIVVGLLRRARAIVVRLRPDGGRDSSFGVDGEVVAPASATTGWNTAALLPDGDIALAGTTRWGVIDTQGKLALAVLRSDGSAASFTSPALGPCVRGPAGIAADAGQLLVAVVTWCSFRQPRRIGLLRLRWDGTIDRSFAGGRPVSLGEVPPIAAGHALLLPGPGHLVAATSTPKGVRVTAVRNDGTVDAGFGRAGAASAQVIQTPGFVDPNGFFRAKLGRLTVAGCSGDGPFLVRFNRDGSPYRFWGGNVELFGGAFGAHCAAFAQRRDYGLVAAGAALVRLHPSGLIDVFHQHAVLPAYRPGATAPTHVLLAASDGTTLVTSYVGGTTLVGRYR